MHKIILVSLLKIKYLGQSLTNYNITKYKPYSTTASANSTGEPLPTPSKGKTLTLSLMIIIIGSIALIAVTVVGLIWAFQRCEGRRESAQDYIPMDDITARSPILSETADQFHSTSQERTDEWRRQIADGQALNEMQSNEENISLQDVVIDPEPEWDHSADLRRHLTEEITRFCKYKNLKYSLWNSR